MCPEHQPAAQAGCDIVTALPPARTQQSMPARELVRDSVPGVTGAGHMGSPCLAYAQVPDSQRKAGFGTGRIVCTNSVGTVRHSE